MTRRLEFSIIVPTCGRPAALALCLQSLARLDYPSERFEVVVVDDGGKASPKAVVETFRGRFNLSLLNQPHGGPAAARNTGAARADGKFLAFTDDDCMPAPDWLQALTARFTTARDCIVGGRTVSALPENPYLSASELLLAYLRNYYNAEADHARFLTSNNLSLSADRWHAIGGFDTTFTRAGGEDREFCDRLLHEGCGIIYAPEVVVYHAHPLTFRTFWKQHFAYGRAAYTFHRLRARRGEDRIELEPLLFYANLLRFPLSQSPRRWTLLPTALLGMSQVANALGFFWSAASETSRRRAGDLRCGGEGA